MNDTEEDVDPKYVPHHIIGLEIKAEPSAGWVPPVHYLENIKLYNALARLLLGNKNKKSLPNFKTIETKLELFCDVDSSGFWENAVSADVAERRVRELCEVYLYIKTNYAESKGVRSKLLGLLFLALKICVKHKVKNGAYVEYAVGECFMADPRKYDPDYILKVFAGYGICHANFAMDVEYLLQQTRRLRYMVTVRVRFDLRWTKYYSKQENRYVHRSYTQSLVPFVDIPFKEKPPNAGARYSTALAYLCEMPPVFIGPTSPDQVLLSLRYGAAPRHPLNSALYILNKDPPYSNVCAEISVYIGNKYLNRMEMNTFSAVVSDLHTIDLFNVFRYMLRADPHTHLKDVRYTNLYCWNDVGPTDDELRPTIYHRDNVDRNFVYLDTRLRDHFLPPCLTESVSSLSRISRYVIRRVLIQNRQIPDGIRQLPVPVTLYPLLDLMED